MLLLVILGCHRRIPEGAVPLSSVIDEPEAQRQAAQWEMPLVDARRYLERSTDGCPTPESVLHASACLHTHPAHGVVAQQPLTWGAPSADVLWHGRLRCHSGASPQMTQVSTRQWLVKCPEDAAATRWFVDPQAPCGNPCPPVGFTVMPADAQGLEQMIEQALDEGRTGDALQLAGVSVDRFPQYASTWNGLGMARAGTGDHRGALDAFVQSLAIDPTDVWTGYCALRAAHSAQLWDETVSRAQLLLPALSAPDMQAEVMCMEGIARTQRGDATAAATVAAACAAGATGCCEPAPHLPVP